MLLCKEFIFSPDLYFFQHNKISRKYENEWEIVGIVTRSITDTITDTTTDVDDVKHAKQAASLLTYKNLNIERI